VFVYHVWSSIFRFHLTPIQERNIDCRYYKNNMLMCNRLVAMMKHNRFDSIDRTEVPLWIISSKITTMKYSNYEQVLSEHSVLPHQVSDYKQQITQVYNYQCICKKKRWSRMIQKLCSVTIWCSSHNYTCADKHMNWNKIRTMISRSQWEWHTLNSWWELT
jgi:hypothetical protein